MQFDLEMSFSQPEELNHIFFLSFFLEIVNQFYLNLFSFANYVKGVGLSQESKAERTRSYLHFDFLLSEKDKKPICKRLLSSQVYQAILIPWFLLSLAVTFHTLAQYDQRIFCPPILELTLRLKLKHSQQDLENSYIFPVMKYVHLYVTPPQENQTFLHLGTINFLIRGGKQLADIQ